MESLATLQQNYGAHREAADAAQVTPAAEVPLMRCVFVSRDGAAVRRLREQLETQSDNARLQQGERAADWTLIGEPAEVLEQIQAYEETLGMTHMVATRIRLPGLPEPMLRESVALLAETVGGR